MNEFERSAGHEKNANLASELWLFIRHTKKWWLLPIVAMLVLFAVLMLLSTTAVAPFIYTLF